MFLFRQRLNNKSFTLIELLIVIAILALLMSIIIITLNPSEMLKKSRDTKRISNVKSINTALSIFQATKPTTSMGTANIVYISIPDSSSTCANLGLPFLPTGYTYQCSTSANYRKTNGTGWIPVNFDSLDIGSPISSLPIDPTNTTSTGLYFTYVTGGSWELTSQFESTSYSEQASTDGGIDPASFEFGTDLALSPFTHGLVGYWKFDETGTSALDSSGFSNTGTIYSSATPTDLHTSSCKSGSCIAFDGVDDYVVLTTPITLPVNGTLSLWINLNLVASTSYFINGGISGGYGIRYNGTDFLVFAGGVDYTTVPWTKQNKLINFTVIRINVFDYDLYIDGIKIGTSNSGTIGSTLSISYLGKRDNGLYFNGIIDEFRIYKRALTSGEILNIYNSGQ